MLDLTNADPHDLLLEALEALKAAEEALEEGSNVSPSYHCQKAVAMALTGILQVLAEGTLFTRKAEED